MEEIGILFSTLWRLITVSNVVIVSLSSIGGILIGAMPGLTSTMGIALLTGITYGMNPDIALLVLLGIYVGGTYGGSVSAILIGIPGTGSAAATVADGHALAMKGQGRLALSLATVASFIGTLFGMVCLAVFAPMLQEIALKFTSAEYCLLAVFGVTICGSLTSGSEPIKGWIAGFMGLGLSCIGYEGIYSYPRFTYGVVGLLGGIAMVPALIGLFGIPSVLSELSNKTTNAKIAEVGSDGGISLSAMLREYIGLVLRSGFIGTFIGVIPGVGEDIAAWLSYDCAKRMSKKPEQFGKGAYAGVVAAETANNACIGGAMIPLLSLAVPGSAPTAVLLGALMLHGIRPGPMLQFDAPHFVFEMCAMLLLAAFCMRIFGWMFCQVAPKLINVPVFILMPIVAALSVIGSFAVNVNLFDVYIMLAVGVLGYFMAKNNYPAAPAVLGLILGPMCDTNLRRFLVDTSGSFVGFFTGPISAVLVALIVMLFLSQMEFAKRWFANSISKMGGSVKSISSVIRRAKR